MLNKLKYFVLTLSVIMLASTPVKVSAQAQDIERARQTRLRQEQERRLQEEIEKKRSEDGEEVVEQSVDPEKKELKGGDVEFEIQTIETNPSEILTQEEIRNILAPLEGTRLKLQELFDAVEQLNQLYKIKNYPAAKAILPPQKVAAGIVSIKLIEGRIGSINIENNKSTSEKFITKRIAVEPGELVELKALENTLFEFNKYYDIALRAVLQPGQAVGTTDYIINTMEPEQHEMMFFTDNAGRDDVGLYRLGLNYTNRSLLGYRDRFSLGYHLAEGSQSGFASYYVPVNSRGTHVLAQFDASDVEILKGQLAELNVTSKSTNFGLQVRHPFILDDNTMLNAFGAVYNKESDTDFDGETLFSTRVGSLVLGADVQSYHQAGSWYMRHALTSGYYHNLEDERFWKYKFDGNWVSIMENNHMFTLRLSGQLTTDTLLPSTEQFQVGGMYTVRGYPEGLLSGDQGYFMSAEYDVPLTFVTTKQGASPFTDRFRLFAFMDHGAAFAFKGNDLGNDKDDYLTSAGLGLGINVGKIIKGRLVVAFPLNSREDGQDGTTLHFYLQSIPF